MRRIVCSAIVLGLLSGCTTPTLTRHYQVLRASPSDQPALTLSVFRPNANSQLDAPFITTLAERAQAELIASLANRVPDNDAQKLIALLSAAPAAPQDPCAWARKKATLSRRLVVTVLGDLPHPADRIDRLQFAFTLQPDARTGRLQAAFASWDRFDSAYESYDLGSAKYTQTAKLDMGKLVDAGGGEASRTLEESMKYAVRRMQVGGSLTDGQAILVQEGAPYINLLGSTAATLSLSVKTNDRPHPVQVFDLGKDGKALPDAVGMQPCLASYPASVAPLEAAIDGKAVVRLVDANDATLSEGDDTIRLMPVSLHAGPVQLASPQELEVNYFGLALCRTGDTIDQCQRLFIEDETMGAVTNEIQVETAAQAAALRTWLVASAVRDKRVETIAHLRIGMKPRAGASPVRSEPIVLTEGLARELRVVRLGGTPVRQAATP